MSLDPEVSLNSEVSLPHALPPTPSADGVPAAAPGRRRWEVWRSPEGQPPWARPALLGIAAVAALLYARNLAGAGLAPFYSVAVKSMSVSWKAFFYGAFDPKATITIDKLAGSFLPQALSARIFGFHPWSLALPQVIEGVVSVLAMYRVVRRWTGPAAGLLAAGIFAATPIAASMFGHSMEDGALTMCLVLAADSWQRAVMEGRLRSLCWAGVWVGLGFQAKMLQAWMILPALGIGYLLAAPGGLIRRLGQLGVAGLVMLAVSLSWIALYTFTPAADRPYVDGSTNNSAVAMVFGYNGVERFGISFPGSVASFGGGGGGPTERAVPAEGGGAGQEYNAGGFLGRSGGWTKLIDGRFGPEIGWLYPLALLALVAGLAWRWRATRTDPMRAGLVMWGVWLGTFGAIYSLMSNIPHTAYMASLAPPLAALSGAGIVLFWRWYRAGSWAGWLLPVAVAAELAWLITCGRASARSCPGCSRWRPAWVWSRSWSRWRDGCRGGPGAPWWERDWRWGWPPCWRRRRRGRHRCWTAATRVVRSMPAPGQPGGSGLAAGAAARWAAGRSGRVSCPEGLPRASRAAERPAAAGSPAAGNGAPVSRAVSAALAAWAEHAGLAVRAVPAEGSSAAPA